MDVATHIEALRREGELMAAATDVVDADAAVPTCPEWRVRDLVRHMGGVHRWATGYVADAPYGDLGRRPRRRGRLVARGQRTGRLVARRVRRAGRRTRGGAGRPPLLDLPPGAVAPRHVGPPAGTRDGHPPGRRRVGCGPHPQRVHARVRRRRCRRALDLLRPAPVHLLACRVADDAGRSVHRRRRRRGRFGSTRTA